MKNIVVNSLICAVLSFLCLWGLIDYIYRVLIIFSFGGVCSALFVDWKHWYNNRNDTNIVSMWISTLMCRGDMAPWERTTFKGDCTFAFANGGSQLEKVSLFIPSSFLGNCCRRRPGLDLLNVLIFDRPYLTLDILTVDFRVCLWNHCIVPVWE